jgi:cardiolipin synthase
MTDPSSEQIITGTVTVEGTSLQFFIHTDDVWNAMFTDCSNAETSIEFEQYILWDDQAGHRFLELFAAKAKQGVKISLLLDRVGSRRSIPSAAIQEIRANGGEVRFYNSTGSLTTLILFKTFPRDHCKTMLIDDKIVYIGSACMAAHMVTWRDTQVRLTGKLVPDVSRDFAIVWGKLGQHLRNPPYQSDPSKLLRYVSTQPTVRTSPIYRELLAHIKNAKDRVILVAPYFLPPWHLRWALRKAIKRGVRVTVMLGEHTDVPIADTVSHSYFNALLKDGLRIVLFGPNVLHVKYAIVDGGWATIGSTNMDYLSLIRNREANLIVREPSIVAKLEKQFERDLDHCRDVTPQYWHDRPLGYKLAGYAGRIFRRIL